MLRPKELKLILAFKWQFKTEDIENFINVSKTQGERPYNVTETLLRWAYNANGAEWL